MSLPASWVDRIFEKLQLVYGAHFLSRWAGMDIGVVKANWAHELRGFADQPETIRYALEHLPVDPPPSVLQFRAICNGSPRSDALALPRPDVDPDPARVAQIMARLGEIAKQRSSMSPAEYCASRIKAIAADRGYMSEGQRHVLACCNRLITGGGEMPMGEFSPIAARALPPGMRPDDERREHMAGDPRFAAWEAGRPAAAQAETEGGPA
jgi:hypothetical protein